MSYTETDAWGQDSAGLEETRGETALGEPGTEPGDDSWSIKVQVSDNGLAKLVCKSANTNLDELTAPPPE